MQEDSIAQLLKDSLETLRIDSIAYADSIHRADSIARIDSIRVSDSIRVAMHHNSGFQGINNPASTFHDIWIFPILLFMFFLLIISISGSGSLISETVKNFFQIKERSSIFSKATVNDFRIKVYLNVFSVFIIGFYAYHAMIPHQQAMSFKTFGYFQLATISFFVIKSVLYDIVGYVFFNPANKKMAKESYFNVLAFTGVLLFPVLLLDIYSVYNYSTVYNLIALSIASIAYILIILKTIQIFLRNFVALFYILLYLCTLEILPLIALYQLYKFLI